MIKNATRHTFQFLLLFWSFTAFAQVETTEVEDSTTVEDTLEVFEYEQFLRVVDNTLEGYYRDYASTDAEVDSIINALGYDEEDVPEFPDSVYCQRIEKMNEMNPFQLECNDDVVKVLKFFAKNRRGFTSVVLGRSKLYFTMYEEILSKHDMPLELKYLSVIESGLRPQIRSRAGALGLWQFMYRTGKYYGLDQNSYIDERMDPVLATEAACLYLKKLYGLYDDWSMALAAYNAGPGNVNKAIRRSGGKMTYWEIRPYLPRETQGYVPNFIAMSYMLTYHAEHNVVAREAKFHDFETDTVCLRDGLHMQTIDSLIKWPVEDIQALNPIYKTTYIPKTDEKQCITIPNEYIGKWVEFEDSIFTLDSLIYESIPEEDKIVNQATIHYVRSGQTLGHIAGRYGVRVRDIMEWNNMRSTRLAIGQKLTIYAKGAAPKPEEKKSTVSNAPIKGETHTIKSGESLWIIANRTGTTVSKLKKLNPGVNHRDLKVGQKIRVK
ncbi:lytic transglycosylase domain-containing protein [Brumimicrobium aurantiacum]|uniref:LysM peptidoglycan-binding domain-containing protein n=1 Tax=Brumimicrobium aurantiacum TaxID=1737063 RepID=A0A3E1F120_9FLAO|nr:lytic transglycosylase domain-containing protein [Brumimicrobium aurantiacum]RFC55514.1 LysM peptidoglycan-binding domain-containing protein [Brumimicrobium aurantiacum]